MPGYFQNAGEDLSSVNNNGYSASQETLPCLFARAVRDHGKKNLIVSDVDGSVFTYAEVAEAVGRIMSKLGAERIIKGDTICIYTPVNVESFLLFWAAANLGVVVVPLDFRSPGKMLERILGQVNPKLLFCDRKNFSGCSGIKEHVRTILFDAAEGGDFHGLPAFSRWLDGDIKDIVTPKILPRDEAVILYTSGSTGDPKGAVLSHGALYRFGRLAKEVYGLTSDDILLNHGDMHSIGGLRTALAALHAGYSFLVAPLAKRSNVFSLAECIRVYRCTHFTTTPVTIQQFVRFQDRIQASDLGSLRSILSAGSVLPQGLVDSFYRRFHVPVLNGYGMTETSGLCIVNSPGSFKHSSGSIGLPVGGCSAEVVDAAGNVLADGSPGELRIRSDNLMLGYYRDRELTDNVIRNGWLYTGDLAMRRTDGHFVLMGRIKNIIKSAAGDLISIEEVESVLEKHPKVREAGVCGFTSTRGDERMAAFIVPQLGPAHASDFFKELRYYLRDELGAHKVPAEFYLKDALPRSSTGKVLREVLKQEVVEA
jgi:acyl-coenzyme A synthetase/AMP-(fatty) acid ligase